MTAVALDRRIDVSAGVNDDPLPGSGARWELVLPHRGRLLTMVGRRLPGADAEDCVQETLLRTALFANLDAGRVGAFLTTTALRLCVDYHRDQTRQRKLAQRFGAHDAPPPPDEVACDREFGRWMLAQLADLPERESAVMLARARGLSTAESARALNISTKAAESAFTRARNRLRAIQQQAEKRALNPIRATSS
jgi:RNA polymerase sigma factor (sigma-70 family)